MTALIITGAIIALICFTLSVFIRFSIVYENDMDKDNSFVMKLKILFLSFPIIPESKGKKINPKDFTYKKYQKLKEKEIKKQIKRQKKAIKSKSGKKASESEEKSKTSVSDVSEMLSTLRANIGDILNILKKLTSNLHVDIQRFRITIGGDDAAKTAITYGIAYPGVLGIFELLENFCILHDRRKSKISVDVDFTSEKSLKSADIKIQFKIRVFHLIGALIRFLLSYLKNTQKSQGETEYERKQK